MTEPFALGPYTGIGLIAAGADTKLYRALSADGTTSLLIKTAAADSPLAHARDTLRHEYELLEELNCAGVPRPLELLEQERPPLLVLQGRVGESLSAVLDGRPWELSRFFPFALALVDTLECLHRCGIVYGNLQPRSILFDPHAGAIALVDFSLASRIGRQKSVIDSAGEIEGVLAYLAPEQTGRMNRNVDYRADYYALGVVLYESLSGEVPFVARDALDMVHCHLARPPRPLQSLVGSIPDVLAAVIHKLLAKLAEDRYQSAAGLSHDLKRCSLEWSAGRRIDSFEIGGADRSERFRLPQRLYGRESDLAELLETFDRVATTGRVEMILVSGFAGVGKSALVAELHRPIVERRGYFHRRKIRPVSARKSLRDAG